MGRLKSDQGQLSYEFHLSDAVPEDHLVRKIDAALDLSWLRSELEPIIRQIWTARFVICSANRHLDLGELTEQPQSWRTFCNDIE
jgi:hypothetical protein